MDFNESCLENKQFDIKGVYWCLLLFQSSKIANLLCYPVRRDWPVQRGQARESRRASGEQADDV